VKLQQISVFLPNQPGALIGPSRLLSTAGIDIRTLSLADTQQFGILRLIVSDWARADELLKEAGFVTRITEVIAVEIPDHPGGLTDVLTALESTGVSVEYMYAFTEGRAGKAVLIFRFDEPDRAMAALQAAGFSVLAEVDVYNR
jgi:hypothetical protein